MATDAVRKDRRTDDEDEWARGVVSENMSSSIGPFSGVVGGSTHSCDSRH